MFPAGFSHRWRNFAFLLAFCVFNVGAVFVGFYLFSIFEWSKCVSSPSHFVLLAADGLLTRSSTSQALAQVEQEQEEREDDAAGQAVQGGRPPAAGAGERLERSPLLPRPHRFHLSPFQPSVWTGCSVARRSRSPSLPQSPSSPLSLIPVPLALEPCLCAYICTFYTSLQSWTLFHCTLRSSSTRASSSPTERDARAQTSQLASAAGATARPCALELGGSEDWTGSALGERQSV